MGSALVIRVSNFGDMLVFKPLVFVESIEVFVVRLTSEKINQEETIF